MVEINDSFGGPLSLREPDHPRELTATQALRDLLGRPFTAESLFDIIEQRPVLLSAEAEEILDGQIASTAARERDDPSLATGRLGLERLRRTLRDCRVHGADAVRRMVLDPLPDEAQAALIKYNVTDAAQLRSDQTMIDWREGKILLGLGRIEEGVGYLKRSAAVLHERGWHDVAAETEMLLWEAARASYDLRASLVHAENAARAYREAGDDVGLRRTLRILAVDADVVAPDSGRSDYYLALLGEVDADLATWLSAYIRGTRLMQSDPDTDEGHAALRWCMESVHLVGADEEDRAHWRNKCVRRLAFIEKDVVPEAPADTALHHSAAAVLALRNEQQEAAEDHIRRAVSLAEEERRSVVTESAQLNLSATLWPIYLLAAVIADRAGRPTEALDMLELDASRSLLARLTMHRLWCSAGADASSASKGFKRQVVRYLTDVERRGSTGGRVQLHTALNRLGEALVAAEQVVLAAPSATRRTAPPVAAARLAEHLGEGDVVVAYSPIGAIYTVTRAGVSRVADLDSSALMHLCAEYRRLASVPDHDDGNPARPAAELGAACVDPVRAAIAGYQRVLMVPNGPLWGVPLGTMGARHLSADHFVAYLPSLSVIDHLLTRSFRTRRVERFVGIGNPDGGLPHTAGELADAASRFYDHVIQTGTSIDVDAFHADLPNADVVHIACHGIVFDKFPDLSALHIAGTGRDRELLWASDLVRLNLRARLVVLAACHAGLSKTLPGNEYVGLPGVLLISGARTVLGPLWRVDDRVTAQFMAHFHAALAEAGPAGALRHAQQTIKAEPATAHPYYWAAFQLFGLP